MATTFADLVGNGQASRSFSFPSIKEADIKVEVDNVLYENRGITGASSGTTTFTITSYTTTGGGNVVFDTAPASSANKIRIYRDTDVDTAKATFTAGSSVKAGDLNNNMTQILYAAQEEQNQSILTSDIKDAAVTTAKIKDANVTTAKIANDAVTADKLPDDVINSEHYAPVSIDTEHIANENVTTAKLGPDAVTSAKLADNAVDSEHYTDGSIDRIHLEADIIDSTKLADNAVNSEHYVDGSIDHVHLANDVIDGDNIQDDVINSEHYVAGSIDHEHLANDIIDGDNIQDNAVNTEHIQTNAVTDTEIATGTLDNRYFTETELTNGALDGRYFTETESDARYFNISTGDTIKDGDTFPDNDTTIATTAAINDRIIDLVDDVGGFVPIANELSFPNSNPDVNNGAGTLVSIKALSQNLTSNSSGVISISNGTVGNSTVTIVGADNSTTYASGFGLIVETHADSNKYTFHRLVPKATEVTTVAGISSNVTTVAGISSNVTAVANNTANINAVAADASDIGTVAADGTDIGLVAGSISNVNTTAGSIANVNTVASNISNVNAVNSNESNINSAVSNASNINSAVSNASNINTVAGSISNVNTAATNIASINNASNNISSVNNFGDKYQVASSAPSTDGGGNALAEGDLYFDTTADELKVYNGSAWQGGVTASGNFASTTGNTFTGSNTYNDNVKAQFGTSADGLEIYHTSNNSIINDNGTGSLFLQMGGTNKLWLTSNGVNISGNLGVTGNVDGRDVAADGTKLDGIEANAINASNAAITNKLPLAGGTLTGSLIVSHSHPQIFLTDTDHDSDFKIQNFNGVFGVRDQTNNTTRFSIDSSGTVDVAGNLDVGAGLDVTGAITSTGDITITHNTPLINFVDSTDNPDYRIVVNSGQFKVQDTTNSNANRLLIQQANTRITNNLLADGGIDVTGNITVTGTVDGRDLATDGTKLDGIESNATADQTAAEIKTLLNSNGIVNAQIDASAAIAGTKISPSFTSDVIITNAAPKVELIDSGNNPDYHLQNYNGSFLIKNSTDSKDVFQIDTQNNVSIGHTGASLYFNNGFNDSNSRIQNTGDSNNSNIRFLTRSSGTEAQAAIIDSTGMNLTGNLVISGTVDGVDIAALNSTVSGITSNATHSGEVTGSTSLTIADNVVDEANLKVSNSPTNGYFLQAQSGNTGGLTWAAVSQPDLSNLNASNLTSGTVPDARFPATLPAISAANLTNIPSSIALAGDIQVKTSNGSVTVPSGKTRIWLFAQAGGGGGGGDFYGATCNAHAGSGGYGGYVYRDYAVSGGQTVSWTIGGGGSGGSGACHVNHNGHGGGSGSGGSTTVTVNGTQRVALSGGSGGGHAANWYGCHNGGNGGNGGTSGTHANDTRSTKEEDSATLNDVIIKQVMSDNSIDTSNGGAQSSSSCQAPGPSGTGGRLVYGFS